MPSYADKSILIVDDDNSWRDIYCQLFVAVGYQVSSAATYDEALDQLENTAFDLAIVDANLEGQPSDSTHKQVSLRGLQLVQTLRAQRPAPLVIISTGYKNLVTEDPMFQQLESSRQVFRVLGKGDDWAVAELLTMVHEALEKPAQQGITPTTTLREAEPLREILEPVELALSVAKSQSIWEQRTRAVTDLGEITKAFKEVLSEFVHQTKADVAHLLMPAPGDDGYLRVVVDTGSDENRAIPISASITGRAYRTSAPQYVPDVSKDADYQPVLGNKRMKSELALPLVGSTSLQTLGVLNVESQSLRAFSNGDQEMLRLCARLIAILFLREDRSIDDWKDLEPLLKVMVEQSPSLATILEEVLVQGLKRTRATAGFVAILEGQELVVRASTDPGSIGQRLKVSGGLAGQIIEGRSLLTAQDLRLPQYAEYERSQIERDHISMLALPIVVDGKPQGVLDFLSPTVGAFTAREQVLGSIIADIAAIGMRQHELLGGAKESAMHATEARLTEELVHRLNNPLAAIRARLYHVQDDYSILIDQNHSLKQELDWLRTDVNRALRIVEELYQRSHE